MSLTFGSVCSGIEAASVAWGPLGWSAAWLAEIEPFPCAVLDHHYPDVPNLGDMTTIARRVLTGEVVSPDVLCGGTPCQAFSVAGLRASLSDARGNLTLKFVELANAIDHVRGVGGRDPAIVFWENVPGVLSTKDNAFGCFLAGLAGEDEPLLPPGQDPEKPIRWSVAGAVFGPQRTVAWRTLDAQYFGVAQRRRRVFVVASARNGFDPTQVLFEWDGLRRDSAPSREAGKVAPTIPSRSTAGGGLGTDFDCDGGLIQAFGGNNQSGPIDVATARNACASASGRMDFESETFLVQPAHTLRGEGFDASKDGTGRGTPLVPVCIHADAVGRTGEAVTPSPDAEGRIRLRDPGMGMIDDGTSYNLMASGQPHAVLSTAPVAYAVRTANTSANGHGISAECAHTLDQAQGQAIAFDTTQITSAANRSNPKPGDACHPLAAGAHAPAIAFCAKDYGGDAMVELSPTLRAGGHNTSHANAGVMPAIAFPANLSGTQYASTENLAPAMGAKNPTAVAFQERGRSDGRSLEIGGEVAYALTAPSGGGRAQERNVLTPAMQVRRLTPVECERLQGFPDNYTRIPSWNGWRKLDVGETPEALMAEGMKVKQNKKTGLWRVNDVDGPRYKALGNSWAIPVVRWIGARIQRQLERNQ